MTIRGRAMSKCDIITYFQDSPALMNTFTINPLGMSKDILLTSCKC